jgi:RimJ/RimL family protein N-acetyltransferase
MSRSVMQDAASFSAIETLRNGRKIEIRAQRPEDRQSLDAAISRMSDESVYRRFFGPRRKFTAKEADYFLHIDFVNHVALVAVAAEGGRDPIIGGGRYIVVEPGRAEVAFAVIDAYQGQGLGAALMRALAEIARQAGLHEFLADVLANNAAMLKVFERSGLKMTTRSESSVTHVTLAV